MLRVILRFAEALHESPKAFPVPVVRWEGISKFAVEIANGSNSKESSPGSVVVKVVGTLDLLSECWQIFDFNGPV